MIKSASRVKDSATSAAVRRVPLLDLSRQYAGIRDEVLAAMERVCASQQFILGEEVLAFERALATFTGAGEAVGCASGTDALWLALAAGGIGPGDEVLTSTFSFIASGTAIVRAGARPVLIDIDPVTFNIDAAATERRVAESLSLRVRAVIPVHLFGQCAAMDALRQTAGDHSLMLLEDAAQAFGATWKGRRAGSLGQAAAFSFYPTKNLSAFGDAGCVTTSAPELAAHMRQLRNHGSGQRYFHDEIGANSRLDAIQAAVLGVKLKHVERWNEARRARATHYDRLFHDAGLAAKSGTRPTAEAPVVLPASAAEAFHVYHQYVIRAERRDDLRRFLGDRGIATEVYYPQPLHLQKCFTYLGYTIGNFPEAERAAREVLALPMFPELTEEEQTYAVETIAAFYE